MNVWCCGVRRAKVVAFLYYLLDQGGGFMTFVDGQAISLASSRPHRLPAAAYILEIATHAGRRHQGATMKLHRCALRLLAGGIGVLALAGGTGVARAQPEPSPPPVPSIIDQLVTDTPALAVDPSAEVCPSTQWRGGG